MKKVKQITASFLAAAAAFSLCACPVLAEEEKETDSTKKYIEETLNLANNKEQEWTYTKDQDGWILSPVAAVAYPEIEEEQGVSVCVPGAYVAGIDTDGDEQADVTAGNYKEAVKGSLIIDYEKQVTSSNGQVYTAAQAPVIFNTGAAGYSAQKTSSASAQYAKEGYINVSCGNRGKQDTAENEEGETYYTGDAPSCLVDQKAAARYVKYNILLGNLPGSVDCFVSTGGSGGGAHAVMFAATSNNPDYYDYEIQAGAAGVYKNEDGTYSTSVTIDGKEYSISDGAWGCVAYSAITSLSEADMALAFEYSLNPDYEYNTSFQKQMARYLSQEYMEYINSQNLSVKESETGFDLNGDGDKEDTISLTIEYDLEKYPETNGYYGTYLTLYLAEFRENLQWYLDNLDYAQGWTWFDEEGNALSDDAVAEMTSEEKAEAFLEGRYTKGNSDTGMTGGEMQKGAAPGGEMPKEGAPDEEMPGGEMPKGGAPEGEIQKAGTPEGGTTQSADSSTDSSNYESFEEMLEEYKADIDEIYAGDEYGNNIVDLYNPLNYIGQENTENPVWTRIVMGASEGDMPLFSSLNLQIAWLNAGVHTEIEWQWDGGHVPSEILGNSLSLYVDEMYGAYVEGAEKIEKAAADKQTKNGEAREEEGKDISSWVNGEDIKNITFTLADVMAYRTSGTSKAVPGFDVMDYGQEDYVFGSSIKDARHWNKYILDIFEKYQDILAPLFNS